MTRVLTNPQPVPAASFDVQRVRADFPILGISVHGKPLIYFDNGATTQKPQAVLDAIQRYYESENANVHRGVHWLSQAATRGYEEARETVRAFINAPEACEIIFTRGTTEGINLVAHSLELSGLKPGDEIIVSEMEHHSNIVPWQLACQRTGAVLKVIPINDAGELQLDAFTKLLNDKTKLVSVVHISNSLGTINPVGEMIRLTRNRARNALVLIDGAQSVAHHPVDVQTLDCDFFAFSGHKLYGPTGIGVLFGKRAVLERMPPYQAGGDMIETVAFTGTTFAPLPNKFEAGTPHIAGAIGLAAAINYVQSVGFDTIVPHERQLLAYAADRIGSVSGVRLIGTAKDKADVVSFVVENPPLGTYDLGLALDREGIAIRTGHHCCMPVMNRLNVSSTARVSLAMYNTRSEIDRLVAVLTAHIGEQKARLATRHTQSKATGTSIASLQFAPQTADTIETAAAELLSDFELFDDAQGKLQYLEDLGANLPELPESLKTDATRVHGCMSIVHLVARGMPTEPGRIEFLADSDASTVRGLVGMMQRLFSGQDARAVLAFDLDAFLKRLGIDKIVTTRRRIGLDGLIKKIREQCARLTSKD